MSDYLYIFTVLLIVATCILIFGARALVAWQGARIREEREEAYRTLAAKSAAAQSDTAARLATLQTELVGVSARLATIETLLRSVE